MPTDPAPRARDRRKATARPLGLLGMLALVVGFESFVAAHGKDLAEFNASDWMFARQAAADEAKDAEILVFGDSLLKFGVVPAVMSRKLGRRVYNLSTLGGQAGSSYFLLRRALDAGARPKAVVVDCQDAPIAPGASDRGLGVRKNIRMWTDGVGLRDAAELAAVAHDPAFLGELALRKLLPSLRGRDELVRNFSKIVRGRMTRTRYTYLIERRNSKLNQGSILLPEKEHPDPTMVVDGPAGPAPEWVAEPVSAHFLARFLALAAEHHIDVYFVLPPTSPEHRRARVRSGVDAFLSRQASDLQASAATVRVIDARASGYARSLFADDTHLNRRGATAFTSDLADAVDRMMQSPQNSPRWAELPPYRDRGLAGELEDLDQSRLALDTFGERRR